MPDPALCTVSNPPLAVGTGQLLVDSVDVGNVTILDVQGEGDNIPIFRPAAHAATDNNPHSLSFLRRVVVEGTLDNLTLSNLELLLKSPAVSTAQGHRLAFSHIQEEENHQVELYLDVGCELSGCGDLLYVLLRRAFIELPWALPFRRDNFTEFVLRFIAQPDATHPDSPYGYLERFCPGAQS